MVRILLVDDHEMVRDALADVLSADPDIEVVAQADTAEEALQRLRKTPVDIVVLDVRLAGMSGIEASSLITKKYPEVGVLILTSYPDEQAMVSAFAAGALGFINKESSHSLLREAIRSVAKGGTFIDPTLGAQLVALATHGLDPKGPYGLTRQEARVLNFFPQGLSNREIAERLGLSRETVKTHVRSVLRKLEVNNRAQAAMIAVREGMA